MKNLLAPVDLKEKIAEHKLISVYLVIAAILIIFPIIRLGDELVKYSVNTPWWDQMSFVDIMSKLHKGTLSISDLWQQHNEHRILVPQAFEIFLGKLTGYNFRVPVFMNLVTAIGSFVLLLSFLKKTIASKKLVVLLAIPLSWLMFSPIQWTNWIWGFQLAFFMSVFFTILTIWLLLKPRLFNPNLIFGSAVVSACITTYCNGNGLLIWPIGLGLLLWRKAIRRYITWWSSVGVVFIASYLYKFHRSPDSPPILTVLKEPVAVIKYTLAYLGRNLATSPTNARYTAFVLLVILVAAVLFIYKKGRLDNIMSWLALAVYVILTGLLAAVSRLNFGVNHGFISNSYPTISLLFILAVIAIAAYALTLWLKDFARPKLPIYLTVFFILGLMCYLPIPAFFNNFSNGTTQLEGLGAHLKLVQSCIYTATNPNDDCLLLIYPDKQTSWNDIQVLKEYKWGNFNVNRR